MDGYRIYGYDLYRYGWVYFGSVCRLMLCGNKRIAYIFLENINIEELGGDREVYGGSSGVV